MSLYDINKAIEDLIDMETGEIKDEAALDALKMEREEKIHNICAYIVNQDDEAESAKKRAEYFTEKRKKHENKAANLRRYLENNLRGEKWKDDDFSVTFRTTQATEILDEGAIPVDFKIPQPYKLDKAGLLRTLKMGKAVPGAALVERQSMTVK